MKHRCEWAGTNDLYVAYHDTEWGVPLRSDNQLFEFLVLEGAQAGLSWLTILKRRHEYAKAFLRFDPQKVARFSTKQIDQLLNNPGIIRNKAKITSAITNAQHFLEVQKEFGSFSNYQWQFVDGKPLQNKWHNMQQIPTTSPEAEAFSKDLRKRGFSFVGPTIVYAHMQAVGMVNDHTVDCFRYKEVQKMI